MYDRIQTVRESIDKECSFMYVQYVWLDTLLESENAWFSEVKCNNIIENKRKRRKKHKKNKQNSPTTWSKIFD